MAKSRNFSIYLLKPNFDSSTALKPEHTLLPPQQAVDLPAGTTIHVLDTGEEPPWWRRYFKIEKELKQSLKGAIVFLSVGGRQFALCFGHVAHHLLATSYEHDFGLIVTLNSVDPNKLKSTDTLAPGVSRRRRTQLPKASDLTVLDFDRDSTILRSLTGTSRDAYLGIFKHATGSSNLRISSAVSAHELPTLCGQLLQLYHSVDYKTHFPEIQNIAAVREPAVIDELNDKLVLAIRAKDGDLQLTVPALIDYSDGFYVCFTGKGRSDRYEDVDLDNYYAYLSGKSFDLASISLEDLAKHHLVLANDDEHPRANHPIIKCLVFETSLPSQQGAMFHLCDGQWYRVAADYLANLLARLDPYFGTCSLPACTQQREDEYNTQAAALDASLYCLDKTSVAPSGQTAVEPCDLIQLGGDRATLYHIKISTRSSQLSHLFNQGMNAVHLFKGSDEAIDRLEALLAKALPAVNGSAIVKAVRDKKMGLVFGIITKKNPAGKTANLPLFSRITLVRAIESLKMLDVPVTIAFLPDDTVSKPTKPSNKKKKKS